MYSLHDSDGKTRKLEVFEPVGVSLDQTGQDGKETETNGQNVHDVGVVFVLFSKISMNNDADLNSSKKHTL